MINSPYSPINRYALIPKEVKKPKITLKQIFKKYKK